MGPEPRTLDSPVLSRNGAPRLKAEAKWGRAKADGKCWEHIPDQSGHSPWKASEEGGEDVDVGMVTRCLLMVISLTIMDASQASGEVAA